MALAFNICDELIALVVDSNIGETLVGRIVSGQKILDGLLTMLVIDDFEVSQIKFLLFWGSKNFFFLQLLFGLWFWLDFWLWLLLALRLPDVF